MIYPHYSQAPWDSDRWPNFHPSEVGLHCACCGEYYHDDESMDMLQAARNILEAPVYLNSGHRCVLWNSHPDVGGSDNSEHLRIAFDISIGDHDCRKLLSALKHAGFTTFGYYGSFIHTDKRLRRKWFGTGGVQVWGKIVNS